MWTETKMCKWLMTSSTYESLVYKDQIKKCTHTLVKWQNNEHTKKPQQMRLIWPWKMSLLSSFMIQLTKMCKWLIVWGFSGCHDYGLNRPSWRLPSSPIRTPARHEVYLSNEWPSLNMIMRGCAPVPLCQTKSRLFEHCHLKRQRYLFVIMQRRQTTHVILLRWIT